ncbi:hypothetical protein [Anatilimnocola aggregata]|uniref:hypothetical protein n=1 Tax=Anatilimnocola aggregata TaxID=2528021 RepID=UPI0011A52A28|nr:hypothetical protein [Anatilimnocola aggregata]
MLKWKTCRRSPPPKRPRCPVVTGATPVVPERAVQNFIFNKIAPAGDLAPKAPTVYGLARALEYYAPNSALYLDNARRALEVSSEFTSSAHGLDGEMLQAATIDAQGRAVEAACRAVRPDACGAQTRSLKVTVREDGTTMSRIWMNRRACPALVKVHSSSAL